MIEKLECYNVFFKTSFTGYAKMETLLHATNCHRPLYVAGMMRDGGPKTIKKKFTLSIAEFLYNVHLYWLKKTAQ